MSIRDGFARFDRIQHGFLFKVVASVVILLAAVAGVVSYAVAAAAAAQELPRLEVTDAEPASGEQAKDPKLAAARAAERAGLDAIARSFNDIVRARTEWTTVAVGAAAAAGVALILVWLGLGLSMLALILLNVAVLLPMQRWGGPGLRGLAFFLGCAWVLTASFVALMQALRVLFSGPTPVLAIARNVVAEAVRMRISVVFIVMLVLVLAALPTVLDPGTPLRYRVQSFLQYGSGGSFTIISILVLFLAAGSVAFEQRDKIVWQTMTKPVSPWSYVLGKWLGVCGVAAVLLAVSSTGVFVFSQYLRNQPAKGEVAPFVAAGERMMSEDRLILETQVLVARESVRPTIPVADEKETDALVNARLDAERRVSPDLPDTPDTRRRIRDDLDKERLGRMLSIGPGQYQRYVFEGLGAAARLSSPLALRYKFNAGGNDPRATYRVSLWVHGAQATVVEAPPAQFLTHPVSPGTIQPDGAVVIDVGNGDFDRSIPNAETISFPPDGLDLFYPVSSFRSNYLRVVLVQWMQLAFLAIVAIAAATFLSFPVACLVSFGVLLCAEGASFLNASLEYYDYRETGGQIIYHRLLIRAVAVPIGYLFKFYGELAPTANLVSGKNVPWTAVAQAGAIMGFLIGLMLTVASGIFRRRELATYSGQ